ncbi:hypothetical protein C8J57DRAFT_1504508 [Mycena rebaudengoi]|nr:hypothetical protein C8J57DRAFT_1504508 [Mycena rebaudengoi]
MSHKRSRTFTTRNPRQAKRQRAGRGSPRRSHTPDGPDANTENSNSDAPQLPSIRADMTRDELYEAARRYEADRAKTQRTQQEEQRNALADVTNTRARSEKTDDDKAASDDLHFVQTAGKKFVGTLMLWLPAGHEDEIWAVEEDEDFNALDRFGKEDQPANKIQGALRDIYSVIPEEYRDPEDFSGWIPAAFISGMTNQRSFTATRLRHHPDLFDCTTTQLLSQEGRREFRKLIGYQPSCKNADKYYYDTINVPVLHADYQGKYDPSKIFLNPLLFIVHAAITLGPAAAAALKGDLTPAKVQCVAVLWALRRTTPGMIAAAAVWLRWLYSVDDEFLSTGTTSAIEWQMDFEYYLQLLTEGLLKRKPSILNIFRIWDNKFYPNSDEGLANGVDSDDEAEESRRAALEEMNEEEAEEEGEAEAEEEGEEEAEEEGEEEAEEEGDNEMDDED